VKASVRIGRVLLASLALVASAVFAYVEMFSQFQYYDDEGYVMVSVKSFLDGHPLYVETFTEYGPFYHLAARFLYFVTGLAVSHDVTRLATIGLWLATAAVAALFIYRLTTSFAWALVAYLEVVVHCRPLCNEPGHPQALLVLLSMSLPLIAAFVVPRRTGSALLGVVAACILLTKINLGVYTLGALMMAYLAMTVSAPLIRTALFVAAVAAVASPFILMRGADWALNYARISALTLAACGMAIWRCDLRARFGIVQLSVFVFFFTMTAVGILAITIALGTSLEAIVTGVFLAPLRFPQLISFPWRLPSYGVLVGAVSLAAALIAVRIPSSRPAIGVVLKLTFGLLIVFAITRGATTMVTMAPLVWVILLPTSASWDLEALFPRAIVCLLTAWYLPIAYPVAGSQEAWATMFLIPAAIIGFADAGAVVAPRLNRPFLHRVAEPAFLLLIVWLFYPQFGWRHLDDLVHRYTGRVALGLPGSDRIRLADEEVQLYRTLTTSIGQECDAFVSMPGLYSLNFWTRKEPPTGFNNTVWMLQTDDRQQQQAVDRLARHPRPCVIYNRILTEEWVGDRDISRRPLVRYIRTSFRTARTIGDFELMVRP
jgi:hypothetical protein